MKRRLVVVGIFFAAISTFLVVGAGILFIQRNNSAALATLPTMPTYDFAISTNTPSPTNVLATNFITNTPTPITPTQTTSPFSFLSAILASSTPRPSSSNNQVAPSPTRTPLSVTVITYTPTLAPTRIFTPTHTLIPPLAQVCKNILYPVVQGQQWRYQANAFNRSDVLTMSILSVSNSQGTISASSQSIGSTKQTQVQCDGDVIRSFPAMSMDILFGNTLDSNLTADYVSGVLAPNEAAFLQNNWALAWSSQYLVSGSTSISRNDSQLTVNLNNSPVTLTCQTLASGEAAFETVTVAAGTFRALKVVCTEQGEVSTILNGTSVTGLAEGRSYQWFAPYVGLVKMQVEYASVTIFDIPFSFLTNNSLELQSVISAP